MAEYLRLPDLHPDDDFFASGGHSLLAAQLLQALGREHGLKIPLATLFEAPTAHQLADWLQSALATRTPAAGTPAPATAFGADASGHAGTGHAAGAATSAFPADIAPSAGHLPAAGRASHDALRGSARDGPDALPMPSSPGPTPSPAGKTASMRRCR